MERLLLLVLLLCTAVLRPVAGGGMEREGATCKGSKPHPHRMHRRLQHLGKCGNTNMTHHPFPEEARNPVMLIPPMLGTSIEAKLTNARGLPWPVCPANADWSRIWLPPGLEPKKGCDSKKDISCLPHDLLPIYVDCWAHSMTLSVDPETGKTDNPPGIESRVLQGLHNVCNFGLDCTCAELKDLGWDTGNHSTEVDGYGYDWRRGPYDWSQPAGYFSKVKSGVERLYANNNQKKVVLLSFSLGGPVASAFLTTYVEQDWKDKYIANWVSYSGTLGGVVESLGIQLGTGSGFAIPTMSSSTELATYRSWASMTWMAAALPNNQIIANVSDGKGGTYKRYTGANIKALYRDAGFEANAKHLTQARRYIPTIPPGVESFVVYGLGFPTPWTYQFTRSR